MSLPASSEETISGNAQPLRPPVLLDLELPTLSKFASEFRRYELLGGARRIPTLLGPHVLSFVMSSIPNFRESSSDDQLKELFNLVRPVTVHGVLDHLSNLRMPKRDFVDINAVAKLIGKFTTFLYTVTQMPPEDLCVEQFILALSPPRLRDRVRFAKPTSLQAAYASARTEATILLQCQHETKLLTYERPRSGFIRPDSRPEDRDRSHSSPSPAKPQVSTPSADRDDKKSSQSRSPPVCHNCGAVGHIRPKCPLLAPSSPSPVAAHTRSRVDRSRPRDTHSPSLGSQSSAPASNAATPNHVSMVSAPPLPAQEPGPPASPADLADHWKDVPSPHLQIIFLGSSAPLAVSAMMDSGANIPCLPKSLLPALTSIGCAPGTFSPPKWIISPGQSQPSPISTYLFAWVQLVPGLIVPLTFYVLDCQSILLPWGLLHHFGLFRFATGVAPSYTPVPPSPPTLSSVGATVAPPALSPSLPQIEKDAPVPSSDLSLSPAQQSDVEAILAAHPALFDTPTPGILCDSFKIVLRDGALPEPHYQRSFSRSLQELIDKEIDTWVTTGIVKPCSVQPFASPLVPVQKKNGSLRLCVDYSALNAHTVDFQFSIPEPRQLLDCLANQKYFATLDLTSGFHQIPLDPSSAHLTAFSTSRGFFHFLRLPFGLRNAPKFFQAVMSTILRPLLFKSCAVYMDDIIIFGTSWDTFLRNLRDVLDRLAAANVRLNRAKCVFGATTIKYLGYLIDRSGISLSDSRISAIANLRAPRTRRQLRSFLGATNFFRSFIPRYAEISAPLTPLQGSTTPFHWTTAHQRAFQSLKDALTNHTKLSHPDYSKPLFLRADASDTALGGVLFQRLDSDQDAPLAFTSAPLRGAQRHYSVMEKELLAIIHSLERFRHFLYGRQFILQTDHRNLLYLDRSMSPRILRWRQRLLDYSFVLEHIPGSQNTVADALSRAYAITAAHPHYASMRQAHNSTTGHRGLRLSLQALHTLGVEWPTMREDMKSFIQSCSFCQKHAHNASDPSSSTILVPEPFDTVAVDTLGPLPRSPDGHEYIIVLIDTFSRFVELRPAPDTSALSAAKAMIDVFGRFGAPRHVKTDGGTQYTASLIQSLLDRLNVHHLYSIPYRPQSNGVVERANQEILRHLRALVFDTRLPTDWPNYLPLIQRIVNATPHSTTGVAPAQLVFGSLVTLDRGLLLPFSGNVMDGSHDDYVIRLAQMQQTFIDKIKEAQATYIKDRARADPTPPSFAVGSLVLIPFVPQPPNKLSHRMRGPLEVIEQLSTHTYRLRHLAQDRVVTVHVSQMVPFHPSPDNTPLELAAKDTKEYLVDSIVSHSGHNIRSLRFKIRWKDCSPADDSDLSYAGVKDLAALDSYLVSHPDLRRLIEDHERKGSVMVKPVKVNVTVNQRQTRSSTRSRTHTVPDSSPE